MTTVGYEKVSLTIETDVLSAVRDRVPRGGLSAYATQALKRQLERDGLADLIGELVEVNGPVDEIEVADLELPVRGHDVVVSAVPARSPDQPR